MNYPIINTEYLENNLQFIYNNNQKPLIGSRIKYAFGVVNYLLKGSIYLEADFNKLSAVQKDYIKQAVGYLADILIKKQLYNDNQSQSANIGQLSVSITQNQKDFTHVYNLLRMTGLFTPETFLRGGFGDRSYYEKQIDDAGNVSWMRYGTDGQDKMVTEAHMVAYLKELLETDYISDEVKKQVEEAIKNDVNITAELDKIIQAQAFKTKVDAEITAIINADPDKYKGQKGDVGPKGDKGEQGPQGVQGPQGPKGDDGVQGVQGDKGDKGNVGPVGPVGTTNLGKVFDVEVRSSVDLFQPAKPIRLPDSINKCDLIIVAIGGWNNYIALWKGPEWRTPSTISKEWTSGGGKYSVVFTLNKNDDRLIKIRNDSSSSIFVFKVFGYKLISVKGEKGEPGPKGDGFSSRDLNPNLIETYLNTSKTLSVQYPKNVVGDTFLMFHSGPKNGDFYQNKTEIFKVQPGADPTKDLKLALNAAETSIINPTKNRVEMLNKTETEELIEHELEHVEDASGYHTIYNQHFENKELNGTLKQEGVIRCDWLDIQNSANVDSDDDWMNENTKYIIEIDYEYPLGEPKKNLQTLQLFAENVAVGGWRYLWRYGGGWNPNTASSLVSIGSGWIEFTFNRIIKFIIEVDVWNNADGSRNYSFVIKGTNQKSDNYVSFRCWAKKFNVAPANFIKNISLVSKIGTYKFFKPEHLNIKIKKGVHH